MPKSLTTEYFFTDCTWTAPAGVKVVKVVPIPEVHAYNLTVAGNRASAIVNCDGYAWGDNTCGKLGNGSITAACQPSLICCGLKWRTLANTTSSSYGITTAGDAYAWGNNSCGELGLNNVTVQCLPQPVVCGFKWKSLLTGKPLNAAGNQYAGGITCSGDAYTWGDNVCGNLGQGSITPKCTPTALLCGLKWKTLVGGDRYMLGLTTDGLVYGWGANGSGQLGIGNNSVQCTPQPLCCNLRFKMISAGGVVSAGITCSGDLYTWGSGACGALGNSTTTGSCTPVQVCCAFKWRRVSVGGTPTSAFVLAINSCGDAYGWGHNNLGVLGQGDGTSRCVPTILCCGFKWKAVSSGGTNSTAGGITSEGALYMWGNGLCGVGGNNTINCNCQPTAVCCGFVAGPVYNPPTKTIEVSPGVTYFLSPNGQFPHFGGEPIVQDFFIEGLAIQYFG